MNKVITASVAAAAALLVLAGCTSTPEVSMSAEDKAAARSLAEQKAVPAGPAGPEDGRISPGDTVGVPTSPGAISGVFCAMWLDDEITLYHAAQVTAFGRYMTSVSLDEAHFSTGMGVADLGAAAAVGAKFTDVGQSLEKLAADKNVGVPPSWESRFEEYCDDAITAD